MVNKRSWPAITVDILEATLHPSNKMRVMYRSNLNFERFNKYFYDLLRKGFIEEVNDGNGRSSYKITARGRTLLEALKKAQELALSEMKTVVILIASSVILLSLVSLFQAHYCSDFEPLWWCALRCLFPGI